MPKTVKELMKKKHGYERVLGREYRVGTKGHSRAVANKRHYDDLASSESGKGRKY